MALQRSLSPGLAAAPVVPVKYSRRCAEPEWMGPPAISTCGPCKPLPSLAAGLSAALLPQLARRRSSGESVGRRGRLKRGRLPGSSKLSARAQAENASARKDYGSGEYWDDRYQEVAADSFDWLGKYSRLEEHIRTATNGDKGAKILDLGCGNATLLQDLYDDGHTDLTGADISEVVISAMRQKEALVRPEIRWRQGDILASLPFDDETFDVVIDKSTMDAIVCDHARMNQNMVRMTAEVSRVLKTGGTYLVFTANPVVPETVLQLPHLGFDLERKELEQFLSESFLNLSGEQSCHPCVFFAHKRPRAAMAAAFHTDEVLADAAAADAQNASAA